jgi:hypothetical protein
VLLQLFARDAVERSEGKLQENGKCLSARMDVRTLENNAHKYITREKAREMIQDSACGRCGCAEIYCEGGDAFVWWERSRNLKLCNVRVRVFCYSTGREGRFPCNNLELPLDRAFLVSVLASDSDWI